MGHGRDRDGIGGYKMPMQQEPVLTPTKLFQEIPRPQSTNIATTEPPQEPDARSQRIKTRRYQRLHSFRLAVEKDGYKGTSSLCQLMDDMDTI